MQIKKLSEVFWNTSPNLFFLSMLLSAVAGVAYTALMPFILYAVDSNYQIYLTDLSKQYVFSDSPTFKLAVLFGIAILSIVIFKTIAMLISTLIGAHATASIRIELAKKINALPIIELERFGQAKLINLLNVDIPRVTGAAMAIPNIWVSLITIIGVLGYLFYINISVFIFVMGALLFAVVTYQVPLLIAYKYLDGMRHDEDAIQAGCRGLILGAKELKLDVCHSKTYIKSEIEAPENARKSNYTKGMSLFLLGQNYGDVIAMLVIGVVVFHLPYIYDFNQLEIFATVMALLYLTGPVSLILGELGAIKTGDISLLKINELIDAANIEKAHKGIELNNSWSEIVLDNVSFAYPGSDNDFCVKGVSASLKKGEVTFIVGGNGSGKSTLSKVISTHYLNTSGDIKFDKTSIKEYDLESVRSSISAIYTDFFLFPKISGEFSGKKVDYFLKYLELENKVSITDGVISSTSLSDGQRKRIALLNLLLSNRPICIFDEWAADQDPRFKDFFYMEIIPELKNQGKLIIVISHDDRYFAVADKVLTMDSGELRDVQVFPDNKLQKVS